MNLIEQTLGFITKAGRYCTAREISTGLKIDLCQLYKTDGFSTVDLNAQCGFVRSLFIPVDVHINRISAYIQEKQRFVSALEIANVLKTSRATLRTHNICIDQLNNELGFVRGYTKVNTQHNKLSIEYIESVKQRIKNQLIDGYIPENTMYKVLGLRMGALPTYIDYKELVKEVGLENMGYKRFGASEDITRKCIELITRQNRYCSMHFLANVLGISSSLFCARNIDTARLNRDLGFFRDNGCFEAQVGEVLQQMWPRSKIITQKWFSDLRSPTGTVLYFDFYIEEEQIAIEADGPCHTDPNHPWYTAAGLHRDFLKNEYCQHKSITLVRIPYSNAVTLDYVKSCYTGSPLESFVTTTDSETKNVTVQKDNELGNQQGSLLASKQEEPSTIISSESRVQENSKRTDGEEPYDMISPHMKV